MYIKAKQSLTGEIQTHQNLSGTLRTEQKLYGSVHIKDTIKQEIDYYLGEYTIKPSTETQTLDTADKTMRENLVIQAIPYAEVTNSANGITVTIGGI